MRVIVTGGNGLVGSRLAPLLATQGHEVFAWGRGPQRATLPGVKYVTVDLTRPADVLKTVSDTFPQLIINPSAMTDVDGCEREPLEAWEANAAAVATLARASRAAGAFLVQVSTDYVFDGERGNYGPHDVPNPRGTYALTKHAGEQAVRALCKADSYAIARTAVVYGWPSAGKNNFGSWLLSSLAAGKPVNLFEDQFVSSSHANNVAAMLAELGTRKLPGIWHTAGEEVTNRVDFGRRLCARFGFDANLIKPSRLADVRLLSPRPEKSGLDVSSTTNTLDARPWTVAQGLNALYTEYKGASS